MKKFKVKAAFQEFLFTEECGGFPASLTLTEADGGRLEAWNVHRPFLSLRDGEGTLLVPTLSGATPPRRYRTESAHILAFSKIPWIEAESGKKRNDLSLSLQWEFCDTGTTFCDMFLFYSTLDVPPLCDCKLRIPLDFTAFQDLHWSNTLFPKAVDATLIQTVPPERFLPHGEKRVFERELFANAGFNAVRDHGPSLYCEFFLEGNNTLFNRAESRACSSIGMEKDRMMLEWNFQKNTESGNARPLHWRNRWGFTFRPARTMRRHRPMTIYHYIDNFQRFPDEAEVCALAESGADLVILHDCWRIDTQNNGIPYDEKRFRRIIGKLHERGIRVALYARGNEISVREDAAAWFDRWLKKDFDGLYLDYGSPFGYAAAPGDENYPGGRIAFREYYRAFEALRCRVGPDGLLYVHTGPCYSGIASGFFDGYVSGEGERGILIRGRVEHEYFTMAAASPGTVWTAAFPEYGSEKMIPFLAAHGEVPHIPLGKQIASSSLEHPPVPGINDRNFAALLHAYSLLGSGSGFGFYTDYNSAGFFEREKGVAHTLLTAQHETYGVMFLANCTGRRAKALFRIRKGKLADCRFFRIPGQPDPETLDSLAPWQVAAALVAKDAQSAERILRKHPVPVPGASPSGEAYRKSVAEQKRARENPPECRKCVIEVAMPSRITSHEQCLWEDLYDITAVLREACPDGTVRNLGYVSKRGLESSPPAEASRLRPGTVSEGIPLHEHLGAGTHCLELYSEHLGEPFYSFLNVRCIEDGKETRIIDFRNELEDDRAILHWKINLKQ